LSKLGQEEEYKVEEIIDSEWRPDGWYYRIKWKGYGPESNTWEPKTNLEHTKEIVPTWTKGLRGWCLRLYNAILVLY
jgi:hypothetical protein